MPKVKDVPFVAAEDVYCYSNAPQTECWEECFTKNGRIPNWHFGGEREGECNDRHVQGSHVFARRCEYLDS